MKIHQRDVVEVNYLFPNGITKPHMAIVISNDDLQAAEDFFYLAMIASKNYNPQYTFPLEDSMLTKNLTKKSFVICQLIGGYTERDVVRICSHVKAEPFNLIVEKIKKAIPKMSEFDKGYFLGKVENLADEGKSKEEDKSREETKV